MKKIISNYSFNAADKKITFSDYSTISLENILLITNVTDNQIIYNFADPAFGGTVAANVLTLTFNTTVMSNADKIQIFYDDAADTPMTDELFHLFNRLLRVMQSNAVVDAQDRQVVRVGTIDGGTIGTVNTVVTTNAVGTLNALNGVDPKYLLMDTSRNTYANLIRSKLIS